jgi:hypothetical protein
LRRRSEMKTVRKPGVKKLALSKQTLRTLASRELELIVRGGIEVPVSPTGSYCTRSCKL